MSARRPFYSKFVWKDWVADTIDLTAEQAGIYIRLLAYAATCSDDCASLPDDEKILARVAGTGLKKWRNISPQVMVKWIRLASGFRSRRLLADAEHFAHIVMAQQKRRTGDAPETYRRKTGESPARARQIQTHSQNKDFGGRASSPEAGAGDVATPATAPAPPGLAPREIRPEAIREYAERFGLRLEHVELLAEKIRLEFDARGYVHAEGALLAWCRSDAEKRIGLRGDEPGPAPDASDLSDDPDDWYRDPAPDQEPE